MPNWVSTDIECTGGYIKEMREAIASEDRPIDFNKIIPMPDDLNVESSSIGSLYMAWLLSEKGTKLISEDTALRYYGHHHVRDFYSSLITAGPRANLAEINNRIKKDTTSGDIGLLRHQEGIALGKRYIENIEKYGFESWYGWCNTNWGTKWNACEPWVEDNVFRMETAWSYPEPVIKEMMHTYKISANINCIDEGFCFWGKQQYEGGVLVSESWGDPRELLSILRTVWGYDETAQIVKTNRYNRNKPKLISGNQPWRVIDDEWWVARDKDEVYER